MISQWSESAAKLPGVGASGGAPNARGAASGLIASIANAVISASVTALLMVLPLLPMSSLSGSLEQKTGLVPHIFIITYLYKKVNKMDISTRRIFPAYGKMTTTASMVDAH